MKPSLILTADWHLRETTPTCRTDDFWFAQWKKVTKIATLQAKYDCPVIHSGDLFHHWKPSPFLLTQTFIHLPNQFYTVYGNHDLPQHNLSLAEKCGIDVLKASNWLNTINYHYGEVPEKESLIIGDRSILVWHVMTWKNELPYPGSTDSSAKQILKKYPQFDLIVTGDNHNTFVEEYKGRILVNTGALTRQRTSEIFNEPCVFLWYAETNTVKQVFLPYEKNVISEEHIKVVEQRNDRIEAFISSLNTDWKTELSFEANLKSFFAKNKVSEEVKSLIEKFIEV